MRPRRETRGRSTALATVVGVVLALAAGAFVPVQAATWTEPAAVPSPAAAYTPSLDIDSRGNATMAWFSGGTIQIARRAPGGTWDAPTSYPAVGSLGVIRVFAAEDGRVTVVWHVGGAQGGMHAITAWPGQPWGPVRSLPGGGTFSWGQFGERGDGSIVVAFAQGTSVGTATLPVGGQWSSVSTISTPPGTIHRPRQMLADAQGNLTLYALAQTNATTQTLWSARLTGGGWSAPTTFATGQSVALQAAAFPDGRQFVVWGSGTSSFTQVYGRERNPDGTYGPIVTLYNDTTDPIVAVSAPQVAIDGRGTVTVAWRQGALPGAPIMVRTRAAGGAWGATTTAVTAARNSEPRLLRTPNDMIHLLWQRDGTVQTRRLSTSGVWTAIYTVGAGVAPSGTSAPAVPAFETDPEGNVLFAWPANGTPAQVRTRAIDDAGPYVSLISVPPRVVAGREAPMYLVPADAWGAVGGVTWRFPGGAVAQGTQAVPVFATPGVHEFTVTLADTAGHSRTVTYPVTVTAPTGAPRARSRSSPSSRPSSGWASRRRSARSPPCSPSA